MPHTFDIRFARTAGFAALLEAPTNSFRFKGAGRLRIGPQGISIAVKRGLTTLFARNQIRHIAATALKEVSREGDALRFEFETAEIPRAVVACWAEDADAASRIVGLLPTTRTVEIEQPLPGSARKTFRIDRFALFWIVLAALALGAAGGWEFSRYRSAAFEQPVPPANSLPAPDETIVESPPLETRGAKDTTAHPEDGVVPLPAGTAAYEVGREQLKIFEAEAATLLADYRIERNMLESGALTPEKFADRLEAKLSMRWWNVTLRILDSEKFWAPELLDLRATLLASARHWRNFLEGYAAAIRKRDHVAIAASFNELAIAEELQSRARRFVR